MKEWKMRQEYFHMINKEYSDDLNKVKINLSDNIVDNAVRHFNEYVDEWIYPAKSYAVAICYASWIAEDFDEDFYEVLNDPELLAGNDPYFVPYEEDKYTYDEIIDVVLPLQMEGMVPDIREYYEEEILNAI
jgi:hypothetical protein